MLTQPWSPVDRKIGLAIAMCGLANAFINSADFVRNLRLFEPWWSALVLVVLILQVVAVAGWSLLPPEALRVIWMVQPVMLFVTLFLVYHAWHGGGLAPLDPPQIWLADAAVSAALALAVKPPYAMAGALALAAAVPLSGIAFLGTVPPIVFAWGLVHSSNVIFVALTVILRQQLEELRRARVLTEQLQREEDRVRETSADFDRFALMVHDEVLSGLAAALHFEGEMPDLVRQGAAAALDALNGDGDGAAPIDRPLELATADAGQLIEDIVGAAAPTVSLQLTVLPGIVSSVAVSSLGLAAAEAARNAVRHAGGGAGAVVLGQGSILITIIDSGHGFDPCVMVASHFGVRDSIVRRVEDLEGGHVTIDSGPGGTRVVMEWNRTET